MTVRELIEKLSTLDQDVPVIYFDAGTSESGWRDINQVTVLKVAPRSPIGYYPRFSNLPERNTVTAVFLDE